LVALQGVHGVRFCNHTFSPTRDTRACSSCPLSTADPWTPV
jgi:hypothetical protein